MADTEAYQYARWSSLEQGRGSTLNRQIEATGEFIRAKGWAVAGSPIIDRGKSAYTGDNIDNGNLGAFALKVLSGAVDAAHTVLVVEELDRLSRQPADVMLSWLSPLVRRGLTIAVVNTNQLITRDMLDMDMGGLMMILITAFGSHTESRKKSVRIAAAWAKKREDARAGKDVTRTHRHPKWLRVNDAGEFEVIPERAAIVRLIFENRISGIGKGLTAKTLNELRQTDPAFEVWPMLNQSVRMWTATYVGRILRSRAVTGWWQPFSRPRKGAPAPVGEPVTDYYPRIIDDATFAQANNERIADALKHQGRGKGLSNLLGTRARCGLCGEQMSALGSAAMRTNLRGETRRHYFLYCTNAKLDKRCENQRGWAYDRVEGPLLDSILTLAMDDQHFAADAGTGPLEAAVLSAKGAIAAIEVKIANLLDSVEAGLPGALDRYQQRAGELVKAKETLEVAEIALDAARGKVSPAEHIKRVSEVRALMWSDDAEEKFQARSRIKAALGDIIESMTFQPESGNVIVNLVDRMRLIVISHAGEILENFDMVAKFGERVGPGYGAVTVRSDGKVTVRNDLIEDQKAASGAYLRRLA